MIRFDLILVKLPCKYEFLTIEIIELINLKENLGDLGNFWVITQKLS